MGRAAGCSRSCGGASTGLFGSALAALDPRWAGGRPRLISDDDVDAIMAAATTRQEKLGLPFTHWSLRKLASYLAGRDRPVRIGR